MRLPFVLLILVAAMLLMPMTAQAACAVDSDNVSGARGSEWTMTVISQTRVRCREARTVMRSCAERRYVPGWTVRQTGYGPITFLRKPQRARSFRVILAGGTPRCLTGLLDRASASAARAKRKLRRCGSVSVITEGASGRATITGRGVSCRFARRTVLASNRRGASPKGWSCLGSGEGVFCAPGSPDRVFRLQDNPGALVYERYVRSTIRSLGRR